MQSSRKPANPRNTREENSQLQLQPKELVILPEEAQKLITIHQDKNVELEPLLGETPNPAKLPAIEQKYHLQIIRLAHDVPLAGHLGWEKIAQKILR